MVILFFAQLKEITGTAEVTLNFESGDCERLWRQLIEIYPGLAVWKDSVRLARNLEYVRENVILNNQDEVALIPPVCGG